MTLHDFFSAAGLAENDRIDHFNLADDRARSLLPHRLLAGACLAAALLLGLRMGRDLRGLADRHPPSAAEFARLRGELDRARAENDGLERSFDPAAAKALGVQVREANFLIALRDLAPTALLADLEAVKPFPARFMNVSRKLTRAGVTQVSFRLAAPGRADYERFESRIRRSHRFTAFNLKSETWPPGGYQADLEMEWRETGAPETTERPRGESAPAPARASAAQTARPAAPAGAPPARPAQPAPAPAPPGRPPALRPSPRPASPVRGAS